MNHVSLSELLTTYRPCGLIEVGEFLEIQLNIEYRWLPELNEKNRKDPWIPLTAKK